MPLLTHAAPTERNSKVAKSYKHLAPPEQRNDAESLLKQRREMMIDTFINDLRYGAKMLWKSKGITLIAVISLAVGIGANSAIFSLINSIFLRPRAISRPDEMVELYVGEGEQPYQSTSYPSYLELRDRNDVLSGLAAYSMQQFRLGDAGEVEPVWGEAVSGNYFDVLGVAAQKGRTFAADEDLVPRQKPVAVISHGLWQRRFNSDPEVIGKTVTLNDQPLTVIGVAPPSIHRNDPWSLGRDLGADDDNAGVGSRRRKNSHARQSWPHSCRQAQTGNNPCPSARAF